MIFTEGDLITMGVVILMLFLFRRLDRNSKSLEKVRRYAEKAGGELDKLVEQKKTQLKDLTVDIDVQERTGREILKRIVANNEELVSREEEIKERLTLVESLKGRMEELNDMTALVDENMKKVADESRYVDTVGGRLKQSQKTVEELNRRLEQITDEFDRSNREKLEVTKTSVMEDYQARLNLISEQLEESSLGVDQFRRELKGMLESHEETREERLNDFAARVAELEEGYTQKLDAAADRAALLENQAFTALSEEINDRTERLERNWFEGMNDLKGQVASQVEEIRSELTEGREQLGIFNTDVGRIKEELEGSIGDFSREASREMQVIEERREAFSREQAEYQERMESVMAAAARELDARTESMAGEIIRSAEAGEERAAREAESRFARFEETQAERYAALEEADREQAAYRSKLADTLAGLRTDLNRGAESVREELDRQLKTLSDEIAAAAADGRSRALDEAESRFVRFEETQAERYAALEEANREQTAYREGLNRAMDELRVLLSDGVSSVRSEMDESFGGLRRHLSEGEQALRHELEERLEALSAEIARAAEAGEGRAVQEAERRLNEFDALIKERFARLEETNGEQEEYARRLDSVQTELAGALESRMNQVEETIDAAAEAGETAALKRAEKRLAEYEEVIRGRFEKLEAFTEDLDALDASLRESMAEQENRYREGMEAFSADMEAGQNRERERNDARLSEIRILIGEIEKELNQLKQQAYDNVSEKLQLFEDDFFTDLRKREASMQESFSEWRKNVDLQLDDMAGNALRDREEVERNGMAQITRKMSELQTRVVDQFDKFQEQVRNFQANLAEQLEAGERNIAEYRQNVRSEWEKQQELSSAYLKEGMDGFNARIDSRLTDFEADLEGRMQAMTSAAQKARADLDALMDKTRGDIDQWQMRLDREIREEESRLENGLDEFKTMVSDTVSDLKNVFLSQKEELVIGSNKDRVEVRKDIADLFERIASLNSELNVKSEQTLELFNEKSEQYLIDYQQRFREAQTDSDEKIKLMRSSLNDTKEKMDSYQQMLHHRIDESYRSLLANVEKIEEKQQEFINQTGIFEQADVLRNALESDIARLDGQINGLKRSGEELLPIREECDRVLSLYDGVSEKMNSFLAEQQKIDLLDGKVGRIINLSDAIDMKLEQVSEADETMQNYMVRLHQLEDLHREIGRRYGELEKKSSVVDATTQSVDRNFQMLGRIEEGLTGISEDLVPLKNSLQEVKKNSDTLMANKEQVDFIVNNVTNLDAVISDFDGRMKKMEKAREWLAGTETRLENISREAQEKVKLLGDLAHRDGRKGAVRNPGSPDMNTREMVIQLARQGWSSEEISRYVKLSRGEVELILELSPGGDE